ncbi:helix-turn-helix domain-containing protein [Microcoleus vaginatus]|uniref:helix-turn-helix domain-containing protein n=1 Tax=Microcoleus vaginatus TaxID=119532 RepID=UPI004040AE51
MRYVTRAHCLILASQGVKKRELMNIFRISYKTLYNWFNRWELEGMIGLYRTYLISFARSRKIKAE